jgi:hypothetical protein
MASRANSVLSPTSFDRAHPWQKRRKKEKEPTQASGPRGINKLSLPIIKNLVGFFNIGEFARNKTINKLFSSVTLVDWQNQQNYVDVCALTCVIRHYSKKPELLAGWRTRVKVLEWQILVFEDYRDHVDTVRMMPNAIREISQCTQIRALQVRTSFLSKEGNILQLAPLTQLRSLTISSVREWLGEPNEDEIATLAHGLPCLEALDFNACFGLHRERLRAKLHKEIPGIQIPASQPK